MPAEKYAIKNETFWNILIVILNRKKKNNPRNRKKKTNPGI
jgi:hypothetical protein